MSELRGSNVNSCFMIFYSHGIRMSQSASPSLNSNHNITRTDQAEIDGLFHAPSETGINIFLPTRRVRWAGSGIQTGIHAAIKMCGTTSIITSGDCDDWHGRTVLGAKSRSVATFVRQEINGLPCGDDDDCFSILFKRRRNGCAAYCFGGFSRGGRECSQFVEEGWVEDCSFCKEDSLVHHGHRFKRICSLCCLARQHDTISTIEDSIADI